MRGMVQIKPLENSHAICLGTGEKIPVNSVCWQGIHTLAVRNDETGSPRFFDDLPIGHSLHFPCSLDLKTGQKKHSEDTEWLSGALFESLVNPSLRNVPVKREVIRAEGKVIVLNCLDMMYGHCLLKLLNASRHLQDDPSRGLIVLIPSFLRWLVPDGVAEIWSVPLGLKEMKSFYPAIDRQIQAFCNDFESIWLSEAYSHPSRFVLKDYTRIKPHDFTTERNLVTFVWRQDRLWLPEYPVKKLRKAGLFFIALELQKNKVVKLFKNIRRSYPGTRFAVAGLGRSGQFPKWIEDYRVSEFNKDSEFNTARLFAETRIAIGIHGSSMLLPSGLAGMTIDLMPDGKWNCLPEDILFQEEDPRLAVFRYRFIPTSSLLHTVSSVALSMIRQKDSIPMFLKEDHSH